MNIAKTDFFILLKGHKSRNAFINFCFNSHKDDFYIFIPAKPLKTGPTIPNASKEKTPKPGLHKPIDRQRSKVLKGVNTGNNGFKDLNSWKSTEKRPHMPENRPYKSIESQEVTIRPKQAPINRLDPETSRGTAKERPRIPAKPRNEKETDDLHKNPKGYNTLLQLANLWHLRLGHLGLNLLKKTAKITSGMPNLNIIKEEDFVYLAYN